jgi:rhodanese-related sulfurtransferase
MSKMWNKISTVIALVVCLVLLVSPLVAVAQTTEVRTHIDSVMENQTKETLFITVDSLHDLLTDDDPSNDPFIIDIRSPEHYELGHIDSAEHMSLFTMAKEENLTKVPKNKTVVVYCYTGQTGAMGTVLLKLLGYKNVSNLKFGMQAWTQNETVNPIRYDPTESGRDYEIVAGGVPTSGFGVIPTIVSLAGLYGA